MLTAVFPCVNPRTVRDLDPSGAFPAIIVPPVPTAAGFGEPPTTEPFNCAGSAALAAPASGSTRMESVIVRVLSRWVYTVLMPFCPSGFGIGGDRTAYAV